METVFRRKIYKVKENYANNGNCFQKKNTAFYFKIRLIQFVFKNMLIKLETMYIHDV